MKPVPKYIISALIVLLPFMGFGQDSVAYDHNFAIDIYVDYGKGIETLWQKQTKWEAGLGILFAGHYNLTGEFGFASLNPESVIQNGLYNAEGYYYRAGFEYSINVRPKRSLSFGAMYAATSFSDYGNVQIQSALWDDVNVYFQRNDLTANWVEAIIHTQGPITNAENGFLANFYWGIRFRLRIMLADMDMPEFDIYAVPGYGRTYSTVVPTANFYLKYRIGF